MTTAAAGEVPGLLVGLRFYTVEELATLFRISERTIRDWLADGRLAGKKLGRRWLVSESALAEALGMGGETVGRAG